MKKQYLKPQSVAVHCTGLVVMTDGALSGMGHGEDPSFGPNSSSQSRAPKIV